MADKTPESPDLGPLLDRLDEALADAAEAEFEVSAGEGGRPCTIQVLTEGFGVASERRKQRRGELQSLQDGEAVMRVKDNLVGGMRVAFTMASGKSAEGELLYRGTGEVQDSRRISGGYRLTIALQELEKSIRPATRRLLECAMTGDFAGWNRWCADLREGASLQELHLAGLTLVNFDLCCADLSGSDLTAADLSNSNLSGADLSGCTLDRVRLTGADLFRVRLPQRYQGLVAAAGVAERESIILAE